MKTKGEELMGIGHEDTSDTLNSILKSIKNGNTKVEDEKKWMVDINKRGFASQIDNMYTALEDGCDKILVENAVTQLINTSMAVNKVIYHTPEKEKQDA